MIINIGNYKYTRILEILKNFQTYVDKDRHPLHNFLSLHAVIQILAAILPSNLTKSFVPLLYTGISSI